VKPRRPLEYPWFVRMWLRRFRPDEWLRRVKYDTEQMEVRIARLDLGLDPNDFPVPWRDAPSLDVRIFTDSSQMRAGLNSVDRHVRKLATHIYTRD
jgi:hypothetical protein